MSGTQKLLDRVFEAAFEKSLRLEDDVTPQPTNKQEPRGLVSIEEDQDHTEDVDEDDREQEDCNREEYYEDYEDDELVEIEAISEREMLQWMDRQEDSLLVCRRLLRYTPDTLEWLISGGEPAFRWLQTRHLQELYHRGWTVLDRVLDVEQTLTIRRLAEERMANGELTAAHLMHAVEDDPYRDGEARGDFIGWYVAAHVHGSGLLTLFSSALGSLFLSTQCFTRPPPHRPPLHH